MKENSDMIFKDCMQAPFRIHGIMRGENSFFRMPVSVAAEINEDIIYLNKSTAGGRVRFVTDSTKIAIRVQMDRVDRSEVSAICSTAGFDLYADDWYQGSFIPPMDMKEGYESMLTLPERKKREITINFPRLSSVASLQIGLCEDAVLLEADDYRIAVPVVYYGSSITQGGAASRPGNSYENMIARRLGCDYINLGFSGSARGETAIARYIAGLKMSAFVYDYDYNAEDADHLQKTHEPMFRVIREENPDLPVVMISQPAVRLDERKKRRRSVIMETYLNALKAGDQNVYFIDGESMFRVGGRNDFTVDGIHPNDIGFQHMAENIGTLLEEILYK